MHATLSVRSFVVALTCLLAALTSTLSLSPAAAAAPAAPAAPAVSAAPSGAGGLFVPATGRLLDTRNGTGGYSTPSPAGAWRTIAPLGTNGIPASGVTALQVTVTAVSPRANGTVQLRPTGGAGAGTSLYYAAGVAGSQTNTAVVALGADGTFDVRSGTAVHLVMDVQGYYVASGSASETASGGGYTPLSPPQRVVDTRNGTGLPRAKVTSGSTVTVDVAALSSGAVPADASAVLLNLEVLGATAPGHVQAYAAHETVAGAPSLTFPGSVPTSVSATVELGAGGTAAGKIRLRVSGGGPAGVHLLVNVVGYVAAALPPGSSDLATFTPASARLVDAVTLPGGSTTVVPLAGRSGLPTVDEGLTAATVNVQVQQAAGGTGGHLVMWADHETRPGTSVVSYQRGVVRSNLATVAVGTGGGVRVHNGGSQSVRIWVDLQGWYAAGQAPVTPEPEPEPEPDPGPPATPPVGTGPNQEIRNQQNTLCLDDHQLDTRPGAEVRQWTCIEGVNQLWAVTDLGNGYAEIENRHSNLCLDDATVAGAPHSGVRQWTCSRADAQQWRLSDVGGGWTEIRARRTGLCLESVAAPTDGGALREATCNGAGVQRWRLTDPDVAKLTWSLVRSANPTPDEADAYARITEAMDRAVARYNRFNNTQRHLTVEYAPWVQTADGNINGHIRFGSHRGYMQEGTALHEISHTVGVGTAWYFQQKCDAQDWPSALPLLREFDGAGARINCGGSHFWPYGLNYSDEFSEEAFNRNVRLVQAMHHDGL